MSQHRQLTRSGSFDAFFLPCHESPDERQRRLVLEKARDTSLATHEENINLLRQLRSNDPAVNNISPITVDDSLARALCEALERNTMVTTVTLSGGPYLTALGIYSFFAVLRTNTAIERINIHCSNRLLDGTAESVIDHMTYNRTIAQVNISAPMSAYERHHYGRLKEQLRAR